MKNKTSSGMVSIPLIMVLAFIAICFLSLGLKYFSIRQRSIEIKDSVENAVIAVAITNYTEVYKGEREGYTGAYRGDGAGNFSDSGITAGAVYAQLSKQLGLIYQSGEYVKLDENGNVEYAISGLRVIPQNTNRQITNDMYNFKADVTVTIRIPTNIGSEFPFGDVVTTYDTEAVYRKRY